MGVATSTVLAVWEGGSAVDDASTGPPSEAELASMLSRVAVYSVPSIDSLATLLRALAPTLTDWGCGLLVIDSMSELAPIVSEGQATTSTSTSTSGEAGSEAKTGSKPYPSSSSSSSSSSAATSTATSTVSAARFHRADTLQQVSALLKEVTASARTQVVLTTWLPYGLTDAAAAAMVGHVAGASASASPSANSRAPITSPLPALQSHLGVGWLHAVTSRVLLTRRPAAITSPSLAAPAVETATARALALIKSPVYGLEGVGVEIAEGGMHVQPP